MSKADQGTFQDVFNDIFRVGFKVFADDCRQVSVHDLHENPDTISVLMRGVDTEHRVVVLALVHQTYLIDKHVFLGFVLWSAELESAHQTVNFSFDFKDLTKASLTDLVVVADLV